MRWMMVALAALVVPLSGCNTPVVIDIGDDPQPVEVPGPEEVIIRGFLEEDVFTIRLAGLKDDTQLMAFDGWVEVYLEPAGGQEWMPRYWMEEVHQYEFVENPLLHWEVQGDGHFLRHGEPIELKATAFLADGREITGFHTTWT